MTDERRGAYAPPVDGDDYEGDGGGRRRGAILLGVAVIVLVAFAGVVWSAYNQGVRESGREGPPRIAADERPFKTLPADPGGYETPDQDKVVYDEISGESRDVEETVSPPDEEPIEMETLPPAGERPPPGLRAESDGAPETDDPAPAEMRLAETGAVESEPEPEPEPEPVEPAAEPQTESADDPAPAAPGLAPDPSGAGGWLVQIAATRTRGDAEGVWSDFASGFPALTEGVSPSYQEADLGERGVFIRVRVPGFGSRAAADAYCAELKRRGQDCITVAG